MNELKTLYYIRTKKELVNLYLNQFSEKNIRDYINDIIRTTRPKCKRCKNISIKESLLFIERYGLPLGYQLSDEMLLRLQELKKSA